MQGAVSRGPCKTHGPSCAMKLWHSPFMTLPAVVLGASIFTWTHLQAARRATGVQGSFNPGPAIAEADPPTHPDSYFPRVLSQLSQPIMASSSTPRHASIASSGLSKLGCFQGVRRGSCTHPTGHRGAGQGYRNLPLNSLNEPAMQRGFTFPRMATLP